MGIHLVKEVMPSTEVICQKHNQTMVECDVIVPDTKPDIKKVLSINGSAHITQKLLQQDKIMVQGIVKMTVLYMPEDATTDKIKCLSASQEFNYTTDCRGAQPDMQLTAEAEAENFDSTIINSRKLNLRCVVGIGTKVSKQTPLSFATDLETENNAIALQKKRLRLLRGTEPTECQIILREQLEFPSGKPTIGEILRITAEPSSLELCLTEGKALAKGQVKVCTLYVAENPEESIEFMEHLIPFTEILSMEGAAEDMEGDISYTMQDMYYEVRENSDMEPRLLSMELILGACVKGSEISEFDAITDAYSLGNPIEPVMQSYPIEQLLDHQTTQISLKDQAQLPPMLPPLNQVLDLHSTPRIDRISTEQGQISVYGTIHTDIMYLTTDPDTPISSFNHITEFNQVIPFPEADPRTVCDAKVFLDHSSYTLSGNQALELRFVLGLSVKALQTDQILLVDSLKECQSGDLPQQPSIILYFVQPGDSLWSIAKRYRTTIRAIQERNGLEGDLIYPGQLLKIVAQQA